VAKDYLPTTNWSTAFWKDGVANIDEDRTGSLFQKKLCRALPYHLAARHTPGRSMKIQRFFIEATRWAVTAEFTDEGYQRVEHFKATDFPIPTVNGPDRESRRSSGKLAK